MGVLREKLEVCDHIAVTQCSEELHVFLKNLFYVKIVNMVV